MLEHRIELDLNRTLKLSDWLNEAVEDTFIRGGRVVIEQERPIDGPTRLRVGVTDGGVIRSEAWI